MRVVLFLLLSIGVGLPLVSVADEEKENQYLMQVIRLLDAATPLIDAAERYQNTGRREQFHYNAFIDHQGVERNGLREDMEEIKAGLLAKLERSAMAPRAIAPIEGDYIARNGQIYRGDR